MTRAEFEALIDAHGIACQTEAREQTRGSILAADATRAALLAAFPASAPPAASGLGLVSDQDNRVWLVFSLPDTREVAVPVDDQRSVDALRAALAATPDARPDPRDARLALLRRMAGFWRRMAAGGEPAALWIAEGRRALEMCGGSLDQALTISDGEVALRLAGWDAPASPQATTPAPSHDAKE